MVIMSAKVSKRKIITGLVIAACVIALLAFLLHKSDAPAAVQESQTAAETDASTEEGRVAFPHLLRLGGLAPGRGKAGGQNPRGI